MKTVTDPVVLERLVERLTALNPDTPRLWGTLTAGEMLCHLSDAAASVLQPDASEPAPRHRFFKWIALSSPVAWPRGLPTPPNVDPHAQGTKPSDFEDDRQRAIARLREFAVAPATELASNHGAFGPMSVRDWRRWAYRHTDHHLRQFGV
jgi:hypothetical protein